MAELTRREKILRIFLFLTLITGILLALFVSFVISPKEETSATRKWVQFKEYTLYEVASICNCSTNSLTYRFPYKRVDKTTQNKTEADTKKSIKNRKDDNVTEAVDENPEKNARSDNNVTEPVDEKFETNDGSDKREAKLYDSVVERKGLDKKNIQNVQDDCFMPSRKLYLDEPLHISDYYWNRFSGIASIGVQRFQDDTDDRIYRCAGVFITPFHVITVADCVSDIEISLLNIRSGSRYWSKKGMVHHVMNVIHYGQLAVFKIAPEVDKSTRPISLSTEPLDSWTTAQSAGWSNYKRKHAMFNVVNWTRDECQGCNVALIEDNVTECNESRLAGDPLLSNNSSLLGIRACGDRFIDARGKILHL